jgi:hypothetical protein
MSAASARQRSLALGAPSAHGAGGAVQGGEGGEEEKQKSPSHRRHTALFTEQGDAFWDNFVQGTGDWADVEDERKFEERFEDCSGEDLQFMARIAEGDAANAAGSGSSDGKSASSDEEVGVGGGGESSVTLGVQEHVDAHRDVYADLGLVRKQG